MLAPGALVHPCPGDLGWGGPLAGRGWFPTIGWWTFTTGAPGPGCMEADGGTAACRGGELDDEEDLKVERSHPQGPLEESPGCFTNQFFMKEFFRYLFWGWFGEVWGYLFQGMWAKSLNHGRCFPAGSAISHHQLRSWKMIFQPSTGIEGIIVQNCNMLIFRGVKSEKNKQMHQLRWDIQMMDVWWHPPEVLTARHWKRMVGRFIFSLGR